MGAGVTPPSAGTEVEVAPAEVKSPGTTVAGATVAATLARFSEVEKGVVSLRTMLEGNVRNIDGKRTWSTFYHESDD